MKKLFLILALTVSFLGNAAETDSTKVDNFKKTDEVLSKVVEKALTVAEKTGEFAIEQAPLLLQEFYTWHISKNIFYVAMWVIFLIIVYSAIKRLKKWSNDEDLDFSDAEYMFPIFFSYTGLIVCFAMIAVSIYNLIFILVAPKLYLIEYFIK